MKNVKIIAAEEIIRDQRVIKEAEYITDLGYNVDVLCWDRENEFKDIEIQIIGKIKIKRFFPFSVYGTGLKQIIPYLKFAYEVYQYLKKEEYEYLHCQNLDGVLIGMLVGRKKKIIFDMREYYEGRERSKIKKILIKWLVSTSVKRSLKVIYVNDTQIAKFTPDEKKKLVYLPNYPRASLMECSNKTMSKNLRITYIGGVRQYEEFLNLFEAVIDMSDVKVSIHGSGSTYKKLKEMGKVYKNVEITGKFEVSDIPRLYNDADITYCVYSIKNENWKTGYGIKLYESIITETPLIVCKESAGEKFVLDNKIGFSVDSTNIEEIRSLIEELNTNRKLLSDMKENLHRIKHKYTWEKVVSNLEGIYQ